MKSQPIKRKKFLLGSLGALGVYFVFSPFVGRTVRTLFLSKNQSEVLLAYLSAILPQTFSGNDAHKKIVIQRIDEELYFVNESIQSEFYSGILLVEFYPWLLGYWSSFSKLDTRDALECIENGLKSGSLSVRAAFSSVRMLCYLIHYGQKEPWKDIKYDGPFGSFPQKISESRAYYKKQMES
ncbi:MAG: hypothetical protein O9264_17485 [Leptospira sp.]|nr:hypothetical protein [Leptospira sp.]